MDPTFMDMLRIELDNMTDDQVNNVRLPPVDDHEKKVKIIDDPDLRKLWALAERYMKTAGERELEVRFSASDDAMEAAQKITELKTKASIIRVIFWVTIKDQLNLWSPNMMTGMREEWWVIEAEMGIQGILGALGFSE